jgi:acyl carrier protein
VANCLVDPAFEETLDRFRAAGTPSAAVERIAAMHRSWAGFGQALADGLIDYVLVTAGLDRSTPLEVLAAANRAALDQATPFAEASGIPPAATPPTPVPAPTAPAAGPTAELLRRHLVETLELTAAPDEDARFVELGLDSLAGLRFLDRVNRALGTDLGIEVIYDHPSLSELAAHIAAVTCADPAAPAVAPIPDFAPATAGLPAEGIAVVGLAVRFPGAATADAFWDDLAAGRDRVAEVPSSRWDTARHYAPESDDRSRSAGKWAGLLDDIDRFDAGFFNMSPREAEYTDPQQRLFLEQCWHALEDAGYSDRRIAGSACGVFVGFLGSEYQDLLRRNGWPVDPYLLLGNSGSILAARIAYQLDLKGPCIALDTACSSSLVAIDLAVKSLRRGECDVALAGGVALHLSEWPFLQMSSAGLLSLDGRCKTFDHRANGIAPGEGVGVVVLKPLERALAEGDQIYGVIRASGTN